jgi:hypothetical protein
MLCVVVINDLLLPLIFYSEPHCFVGHITLESYQRPYHLLMQLCLFIKLTKALELFPHDRIF